MSGVYKITWTKSYMQWENGRKVPQDVVHEEEFLEKFNAETRMEFLINVLNVNPTITYP